MDKHALGHDVAARTGWQREAFACDDRNGCRVQAIALPFAALRPARFQERAVAHIVLAWPVDAEEAIATMGKLLERTLAPLEAVAGLFQPKGKVSIFMAPAPISGWVSIHALDLLGSQQDHAAKVVRRIEKDLALRRIAGVDRCHFRAMPQDHRGTVWVTVVRPDRQIVDIVKAHVVD